VWRERLAENQSAVLLLDAGGETLSRHPDHRNLVLHQGFEFD